MLDALISAVAAVRMFLSGLASGPEPLWPAALAILAALLFAATTWFIFRRSALAPVTACAAALLTAALTLPHLPEWPYALSGLLPLAFYGWIIRDLFVAKAQGALR